MWHRLVMAKNPRGPFVHVPVTVEMKRKLDKRAAEEDRSIAQVVRRAIAAHLAQQVMHPIAAAELAAEIEARTEFTKALDHAIAVLEDCAALRGVSIEAHGPGEAVYVGRDEHHHGYNIALVTEPDPAMWPRVRDAICRIGGAS